VKTVEVKFPLSERASYEIRIKSGILEKIGEMLKPLFPKVKTFAIITDENVAAIYERRVADSLIKSGYEAISCAVPPGEKSKGMAQYFTLQRWLAKNQITRSDAIIALGGGVVGDLAGFTAATYLRGIPFVQAPTTVLSMVDSSVGGKTGIDIPEGKNLVGAFYQPSIVFCDPDTLLTLTPEVFADGCAEIVKHAMICGAAEGENNLLQMLLFPGGNAIHEQLPLIIEENIKIKRDIVQKDEFDKNERQLLNFGHTIGHAIERLSNFEISHGNAVAIGMSIITRAAVRKKFCPPECQTIIEKLLEAFNLPTQTNYEPQDIFNVALTDKKRMGDTITEVIPIKKGECILQKMPVNDLLDWIAL